jgi:hypothetical protein
VVDTWSLEAVMAMTREERELGGIEFPSDGACRFTPLDREDYLNAAFGDLRNPTIAKLLTEYDPELVVLVLGGASARTALKLRQLVAHDDLGPYDGEDQNVKWFDRQMYLDYAFQRLSGVEKLSLLRHCERDLLNYIRSSALVNIAREG